VKDADRPPFTGKDELRKTISIEIAPDCTTDHADLVQQLGVGLIQNEGAIGAAVNPRTGRLGIPSRLDAPANKKIQNAVTVNVAQRQRPRTGFTAPDQISNLARAKVVFLHAGGGRLTVLVGSRTHQ